MWGDPVYPSFTLSHAWHVYVGSPPRHPDLVLCVLVSLSDGVVGRSKILE